MLFFIFKDEHRDCLKGLMKYAKETNSKYRDFLIQSASNDPTRQRKANEKEDPILLLYSEENMDAISMVFGLMLMQRALDKHQSLSNASTNTVRDNKVLQLTVSYFLSSSFFLF
jgi:hypothetical protein